MKYHIGVTNTLYSVTQRTCRSFTGDTNHTLSFLGNILGYPQAKGHQSNLLQGTVGHLRVKRLFVFSPGYIPGYLRVSEQNSLLQKFIGKQNTPRYCRTFKVEKDSLFPLPDISLDICG